jgi:magnesium-protoporphyrin IX monomethyl ester (oxidative) cyclase
MVRVLILNPPLPEKNGMPLLSQMYIASSLLSNGHDVKIIDLNAKYYQYDLDTIITEISSYQPNVICMSLYTQTATFAYEFVTQLRNLDSIGNCLLIAGGPHATAVPEEPLKHGFDVVVRGEGEFAIIDLMEQIEGNIPLIRIKGISYKTSSKSVQHGAARPLIEDLNSISLPIFAMPLFNPDWYYKGGNLKNIPAGLITSRGCPSKCTFCANIVTGRKFRYRSTENILKEINYYNTKYGTTFFSFWDDVFTSDIPRVLKLCEEFKRLKKLENFDIQWSCITRADKLSKRLVSELASAGCISINFGVESGSPETLSKIQKGIDLAQVAKSLKWCKAEGLRTQVNFMLGFPWELEKHLQETLNFMIKISDLVDAFSSRGVVIPYAGTGLYESYKKQYGFDTWWLKRNMDIHEKSDQLEDVYFKDPTLDMDFFKYSPRVKKMIQKCLEYKGEQTISKLGI